MIFADRRRGARASSGPAALVLAYRALRVRRLLGSRSRCRDPFGKRLAAGLTALVCGQAAVNLGAVMGLAPLTGIPLPFVSYGGIEPRRLPRGGRHPP